MSSNGGKRRVAQRVTPSARPKRKLTTTPASTITKRAPFNFWHIQRVMNRVPRGTRRNFDQLFALDHMVYSAFENGSVQQSFRRMHESNRVTIELDKATINDVTQPVYFIGSEHELDMKIEDWQKWLTDGMRSNEHTCFTEYLTNDHPFGYPIVPIVAWWSLDADVFWTLDSRTADTLLQTLRER